MQGLKVPAGQVVVKAGEQDRSLYFVISGEFEVTMQGARGQIKLGGMQPGDIFGELAFFDMQPRSADVRAVKGSEVMVLNAGGFDRLKVTRPALALSFVLDLGRVLSLRFRELNKRLNS